MIVRFDRKAAIRRSHKPAATHALHFVCELFLLLWSEVFDYSITVHDVESAVREGQRATIEYIPVTPGKLRM